MIQQNRHAQTSLPHAQLKIRRSEVKKRPAISDRPTRASRNSGKATVFKLAAERNRDPTDVGLRTRYVVPPDSRLRGTGRV